MRLILVQDEFISISVAMLKSSATLLKLDKMVKMLLASDIAKKEGDIN